MMSMEGARQTAGTRRLEGGSIGRFFAPSKPHDWRRFYFFLSDNLQNNTRFHFLGEVVFRIAGTCLFSVSWRRRPAPQKIKNNRSRETARAPDLNKRQLAQPQQAKDRRWRSVGSLRKLIDRKNQLIPELLLETIRRMRRRDLHAADHASRRGSSPAWPDWHCEFAATGRGLFFGPAPFAAAIAMVETIVSSYKPDQVRAKR